MLGFLSQAANLFSGATGGGGMLPPSASSATSEGNTVTVGGLTVPAYPFATGPGFTIPNTLTNWILGFSALALVVALVAGRKRKKGRG